MLQLYEVEGYCEVPVMGIDHVFYISCVKEEKMVQMMNKMEESSRWWWFDSHHDGSKRSQWLQSTLSGAQNGVVLDNNYMLTIQIYLLFQIFNTKARSESSSRIQDTSLNCSILMIELDSKTKAMLKLIEEDADSFAKRAEMYYKKRPELISLVEDFYRSHRLLAERYDQIKLDPGNRLVTQLGSPFSSMKYCHSEKTINLMDKLYDSSSETFESEDYAESEVDDPEHDETGEEVKDPKQEDKYEAGLVTKEGHVVKEDESSKVFGDELMKLREKIEKLKEENKVQKAQLIQKDEEKKEVIRQLSYAVQALKDENMELKKNMVKRPSPSKWSPFEFNKINGGLFGMLLNGSPLSRSTIIAL
ncbi:hypothetical protein Goshw_021849 [Gossypium schwendimanii]|uniref:NAB domain-containing protein n=1 Tax=Gossypium schwendimanii TaxID=34291 RepID=A0A7J9L5U9_GOSSC|nr:hypothetical protein [Gossypium schwendimanii]